ncbi:MAG: DUF4037 domain-containing protein [Treponema sp.]|nr:DUF4037 domain-containing protein [Treponema sp.]
MKYKTKMLVDRFSSIISQWTGVECVALNEAALPDTLDPYFALVMDIYYRDKIPGAAERRELYGDDLEAFETSGKESKDRFIIGDIPIRLEYKSVGMIEELVSIADTRLDSLWFIKDSGTYGFYRLSKGEVVFSRTDWIKGIRSRLEKLGDEFWQNMRNAHEFKMEHFLSDLGAALMRGDDFFYLTSAAGFIKTACLTLFCINRHFEPSHRAYYKQVLELKELPGSFQSYFETFLRPDPEITRERKFSLAQLIARGIVSL